MLWNKGVNNYVTYYREEDGLQLKVKEAFDFLRDNVFTHLSTEYHDQIILAGGALRSYFTGTKIRDYDIYLKQGFEYDRIRAVLIGVGFKEDCITERSTMFKLQSYDTYAQEVVHSDINVIRREYDSPQEVIDGFDFTVCMCAITKSEITYHPDYFIDLATRQLRINNPQDPLSTLWRLQKYVKLGYTIEREELWKIASGIHDLSSLPTVIGPDEDKANHSLKNNVKTLEDIFRSS